MPVLTRQLMHSASQRHAVPRALPLVACVAVLLAAAKGGVAAEAEAGGEPQPLEPPWVRLHGDVRSLLDQGEEDAARIRLLVYLYGLHGETPPDDADPRAWARHIADEAARRVRTEQLLFSEHALRRAKALAAQYPDSLMLKEIVAVCSGGEKAREEFEQLCAADEATWCVWHVLGYLRMGEGRAKHGGSFFRADNRHFGPTPESIEAWEGCVRRRPDFTYAWRLLAYAHWEQGDVEAAAAAFRSALEHGFVTEGGASSCRQDLIELLLEQGQIGGFIAEIRKEGDLPLFVGITLAVLLVPISAVGLVVWLCLRWAKKRRARAGLPAAPERFPAIRFRLRHGIGAVVAMVAMVTVASLFVPSLRDTASETLHLLALASAADAVVAAGVVLLAMRLYGSASDGLLLSRCPWPQARRWLGGGMLALLVVGLLYNLLLAACDVELKQMLLTMIEGLDGPAERFATFLMAGCVVPVTEEIIFRGCLYQSLKKAAGVRWAVCLSAAVFALVHMEPVVLPLLFVMGLLMAVAYERTGSLLIPIALHVVNNLIATGVVFLIASAG